MATTPPRFHRLTVREVHRETDRVVSLVFDVPDLLREAYAFEAGQYLTLRATIDYAICERGQEKLGRHKCEDQETHRRRSLGKSSHKVYAGEH